MNSKVIDIFLEMTSIKLLNNGKLIALNGKGESDKEGERLAHSESFANCNHFVKLLDLIRGTKLVL